MPATFPNESEDYRAARERLLEAEIALRAQLESVAAQRRTLPLGGEIPEDYAFEEIANGAARTTRLSELFGPHQSLILYSFMFAPEAAAPCPACTSLLDSLDGAAEKIGQRAGFAVIAKSPATRLQAFADGRGWRSLRLLSSGGNSYNRDYHAETPDGAQIPACSVFTKRDGAIRHFWSAELLYAKLDGHPRHMDLLWPLWGAMDLTPEGRGDWFPTIRFEEAA